MVGPSPQITRLPVEGESKVVSWRSPSPDTRVSFGIWEGMSNTGSEPRLMRPHLSLKTMGTLGLISSP